jgi:hypothetical protein
LAKSSDMVVHLQMLVKKLSLGHVVMAKELMFRAGDEVCGVFDRHYRNCGFDYDMDTRFDNFAAIWKRVLDEHYCE